MSTINDEIQSHLENPEGEEDLSEEDEEEHQSTDKSLIEDAPVRLYTYLSNLEVQLYEVVKGFTVLTAKFQDMEDKQDKMEKGLGQIIDDQNWEPPNLPFNTPSLRYQLQKKPQDRRKVPAQKDDSNDDVTSSNSSTQQQEQKKQQAKRKDSIIKPFTKEEEISNLPYDETDVFKPANNRHSIIGALCATPIAPKGGSSYTSKVSSDNNVMARNQIMHTHPLPSQEHLRLAKLSIQSLLKFLTDIEQYEDANEVQLTLQSKITPEVKDALYARFPTKLHPGNFKTLSRYQLIVYLVKYVGPRDSAHFSYLMSTSVKLKLPDNFVYEVKNYQTLFNAANKFKLEFTNLHDIFCTPILNSPSDKRDDYLPKCTFKEGGLAKIFMANFPDGFSKQFVLRLSKHSFENLDAFLVQFNTLMNEFNKTYLLYKTMDVVIRGVGTTTHPSKGSNFANSHHQSHKQYQSVHHISLNSSDSYNCDTDKYVPSSEENSSNAENSSFDEILMDEQQSSEDQEDQLSSDLAAISMLQPKNNFNNNYGNSNWNNNKSNSYQSKPSPVSILKRPPYPSNTNSFSSNNHSNTVKHVSIASATPTKSALHSNNICNRMLLTNSCNFPGCTYIHDGPQMVSAWERLQSQLNDSRFKPSSRPRLSEYNSISHLSATSLPNNAETYTESDDFEDVHALSHIKQSLMMLPETTLISSVVRPAILSTSAIPGETFSVQHTLLDTGALHASYISSNLVNNAFGGQLKSSLVLIDKQMHIKLADGVTKAILTHSLPAVISIQDNSGKIYEAEITLLVTELGTDIIIGLPDIIQHFAPLLQSLLGDHMVLAASNQTALVDSHFPSAKNSDEYKNSSTIPPWANSLDVPAPEDVDTPLPCSFPTALHFLSTPRAELLKEFEELIPTHVNQEFLNQTNIRNLLLTKGTQVFIPQSWEGVKLVPPLELNWREDIPSSMKPRTRPVNPKLFENACTEFQRLREYFYVPSSSPIASPLVIAPKATKPFIRFCGDYVAVSKYIITGHYPIPRVQQSLEKIINFPIKLDFDLTHSFHQFMLDPISSARLSVTTPWGQFQPLFLPEGIPPASGFLQSYMDRIFAEIMDYAIVIFDNLLVLATDYQDAFVKVNQVLDICIRHNLYLKFPKTWLGYNKVNFFGYVCEDQSYRLGEERIDSLMALPFPTTRKKMQSFLGMALFFRNFVPNFSSLTAPLHDTTKSTFNWSSNRSMLESYHEVFEKTKVALAESQRLFYPDFSLPWTLRTDASISGVGAVLLQTTPNGDEQPISFVSKKLSEPATRWATIEQEAFAIYFGVSSLEHLLRGKPFILETDHANLIWIESSLTPKIMRWRVYLQSFPFMLRHIPGKSNLVADYLSRQFETTQTTSSVATLSSLSPSLLSHMARSSLTDNIRVTSQHDSASSVSVLKPKKNDGSTSVASDASNNTLTEDHGTITDVNTPINDSTSIHTPVTPEELLSAVHNARVGHHGIRRTWLLLTKHFPGHKIPVRFIQDWIAQCPICQKERLGMTDKVQALVKHLRADHLHSAVGMDTLTITPADSSGNCYLHVVVNHFSKLVDLYPAKANNALTAASALFCYFSTYGLTEVLLTDPGVEYTNETIAYLTRWVGVLHRFSLVDRHQSNGVEQTNAKILLVIRNLVNEERIRESWSLPFNIATIRYILNSTVNSETGHTPLSLHFGSTDELFHQLPASLSFTPDTFNEFLRTLDSNLHALRTSAAKFHSEVLAERIPTAESDSNVQNCFQKGDYILVQASNGHLPRTSKLTPKYKGPYEVILHEGNSISARHLSTGSVVTLHPDRVKVFHGNAESARKMADIDYGQHLIDKIISYSGSPLGPRTKLDFLVQYHDGDQLWLPYSKDLFESQPFEDYCRSTVELMYTHLPSSLAAVKTKEALKQPITCVEPGNTVYVKLKILDPLLYANLPLEDRWKMDYVYLCTYLDWPTPRAAKTKREIQIHSKHFSRAIIVNSLWVTLFGSTHTFHTSSMILITDELVDKIPQLSIRI